MLTTAFKKTFLLAVCITVAAMLSGCPTPDRTDELNDAAQTWMRLALEATRAHDQGPTVQARKLWHISATMYEAWAVYDESASGYFTGKDLKPEAGDDSIEQVAETLSHSVYLVLRDGFKHLAGEPQDSRERRAYAAFTAHMQDLGYLDATGRAIPSPAQRLGSKIATSVLEFCETDGANEPGGYTDTSYYRPLNPPLELNEKTPQAMDVNYWQPIGIPDAGVQGFLTPHWCFVTPFSLASFHEERLRIDPGPPPLFGTSTESEFIDGFMEVLEYSASLDPAIGAGRDLIDISPAARGNNNFPFDDGSGHELNPVTGQPYHGNFVRRGDFYRAQAAFLDGHRFNMPGPWWFDLATDVLAGTGMFDKQPENKPSPHDLEYDVKLYFALGGALHDTAIAVWDVKRHYDWVRPITAIRWLGERNLLPLQADLVEIIGEDDPLAGPGGANVGRQKIKAWYGPFEGVGWMLPEHWIPYQAPDLVTPPFAGYTSGHAAFAWGFKEVMVAHTGDEFVPGGLLELEVTDLPFDGPPSQPVTLQWATYQDIADASGLGRTMCGVHPVIDAVASRPIGRACGERAVAEAREYFQGLRNGVLSK